MSRCRYLAAGVLALIFGLFFGLLVGLGLARVKLQPDRYAPAQGAARPWWRAPPLRVLAPHSKSDAHGAVQPWWRAPPPRAPAPPSTGDALRERVRSLRGHLVSAFSDWRSITGLLMLACGAFSSRLRLLSAAAGAAAAVLSFFRGGAAVPRLLEGDKGRGRNGSRAAQPHGGLGSWARSGGRLDRCAQRAARSLSEPPSGLLAVDAQDGDCLVERPALSAALDAYLEGAPGTVLFVAGPEGSGKSAAVRHCLSRRAGVLPVCLGESVAVAGLYATLLRTAGLKQDSGAESVHEQLVPFLKMGAQLYRAKHRLDSVVAGAAASARAAASSAAERADALVGAGEGAIAAASLPATPEPQRAKRAGAGARPRAGPGERKGDAARGGGSGAQAGAEWLPTLHLEVEASPNGAHLALAMKIIKAAAIEHAAARAVVVLACPFELGLLPAWAFSVDRSLWLWVGDMAEDEADAQLRAAAGGAAAAAAGAAAGAGGEGGSAVTAEGAALADEAAQLRAAAIAALGTRPSTIDRCARLLARCASADERAEAVRALAAAHARCAGLAVDRLLALSLPLPAGPTFCDFGRLMRELLARGSGACVPCEQVASYMPPPCAVLAVLGRPEHDALLYDPAARGYRFNSRAHERAARQRLLEDGCASGASSAQR